MSNSNLICYSKISPNKTVCNDKVNDTISIHCMAGQLSVESCGDLFANPKRQASSNYGIGPDGRIALYVEEKDRSWCTSNKANDMRAVTIEVASDSKHPYAVKAAAYNSLIELVADICKRNGIKKLVWSTNKTDRVNHKNGCNMTVHRDYASKACPGDWLYNRMGEIAAAVNAKLGAAGETVQPTKPADDKPVSGVGVSPYTVRITTAVLNVRKGPGTNYGIAMQVKNGEVFTIVEEYKNGSTTWGKLKSGVGWISLAYTKKR